MTYCCGMPKLDGNDVHYLTNDINSLDNDAKENASAASGYQNVSSVREREIQSHVSYLPVSLTPLQSDDIPRRYSGYYAISGTSQRIHTSVSRPCSPPPATTLPPFRRPSLSLPPSPRILRNQRASLPSLLSTRAVATSRSPSPNSSLPSSTANSRPHTPNSPPFNRRNSLRRSARTPSPRPPLPRPSPLNLPAIPARSKPEFKSSNARMRSR